MTMYIFTMIYTQHAIQYNNNLYTKNLSGILRQDSLDDIKELHIRIANCNLVKIKLIHFSFIYFNKHRLE